MPEENPIAEFRPPQLLPVVVAPSSRSDGHTPISSWNQAAEPPPRSSLPRMPIALPGEYTSCFVTPPIVPVPLLEYLLLMMVSSSRPYSVMPLLDATPGDGTIACGVSDVCAKARPGAVSAPATASAISFLFIENVSSSIDSRAAGSRRPSDPERGLLQFCQSNPASSTANVIFVACLNHRCCICATNNSLLF